MNRDKLISILEREVENKNIIKHMLATEACMKALARQLRGDEEEWALSGLMHDGDYKESVPVEKQGVEIVDILKKEGIEVSPAVGQAMAAHNWSNTGVEPKALMDWSLFCADSLTGLIVATALVLPGKKLSEATVERVLNRFKEKSFARGTRREDIQMCEKKLGISLEDFIKICLKAMQKISRELGL
ncbi:MAG: phosphohydrolase [Candidatus Shapirobacteria bacterium]